MHVFDTAAVLVAIAATAGYVNYRLFRLPATSGTLIVALASSFFVMVVNAIYPDLELQRVVTALVSEIDFNQTLMHGMLCFLLFAGALGVDLDEILSEKCHARRAAAVRGSAGLHPDMARSPDAPRSDGDSDVDGAAWRHFSRDDAVSACVSGQRQSTRLHLRRRRVLDTRAGTDGSASARALRHRHRRSAFPRPVARERLERR
jgi:hypothetical protein